MNMLRRNALLIGASKTNVWQSPLGSSLIGAVRTKKTKSKIVPSNEKGAALRQALAQIESNFGKGSIMQLGQEYGYNIITTYTYLILLW